MSSLSFTRSPFNSLYSEVYDQLVSAGIVIPQPERQPPTVPMDYSWAQVGAHFIVVAIMMFY